MTELAEKLKDVLTSRPQSKETLQIILKANERSIREAVTELRKYGYNVTSNSGHKGYWYGSEDEKKRTIAEYRSRAYDLLETARAMEQGPDAQIEFEEAIFDEVFANA